MATALTTIAYESANEGSVALARTSILLRSILTTNPRVETFTIGSIVNAMGPGQVETFLMLFALPGVVPVPDAPSFSDVGASALGVHLALGRKQPLFPKTMLNKKVPRRSLAVAIHLLLPVLERAEKAARPRLAWALHPISRGVIGMLVFLLAVTIAFPLVGFDQLHALSIFIISLGLAEKDGVAVLLGVVAGIASIALVTAVGLTSRLLRSRFARWLRKLARRFGRRALATICQRRGWKWLADLLHMDWQELLLLWNPEKAKSPQHERQSATAAKTTAPRRDYAARRSRHTHQTVRPRIAKQQAAIAGRSIKR